MSIWQENLSEKICLVHVSGRLDQTSTPELERELLRELDTGKCQLVVDLSEVVYVNSSGLRTLLTAWRKANERDARILLCCLSDRVLEVFSIVGFDKVFEIFDTADAAVATLKED